MAAEFRVYRPGEDDAALLDLRRAVWGDDHIHNDVRFFEWLYQRNPSGTGAGIVIEDAGSMIGFMGLAPKRMVLSSKECVAGYVVDYMVHDGKRSGLTGRLALKLLNEWCKLANDLGLEFGVGYPRDSSYRISVSPRAAWRPVIVPDLFLKPSAHARFHEAPVGHLPPMLATVGARLGSLYCWIAGLRRKRAAGRLVELTSFDERVDRLWARWSENVDVSIVRDSTYMTWRYFQNPIYRYRVLGWEDDQGLRGLLITSARDVFGIQASLVVDWMIDPTAPAVADALLHGASSRLKEDRCGILIAVVFGETPMRSALSRSGFVKVPAKVSPKSFNGVVHDLGRGAGAANGHPFAEPGRWSWAWGDMDVV